MFSKLGCKCGISRISNSMIMGYGLHLTCKRLVLGCALTNLSHGRYKPITMLRGWIMAVASGPAGPVLAGPVFAFKTAHAQRYVISVAPRNLLRCDHSVSCGVTSIFAEYYYFAVNIYLHPVARPPPFIPALRLRDLETLQRTTRQRV